VLKALQEQALSFKKKKNIIVLSCSQHKTKKPAMQRPKQI
jgi:hypothetical protein